MLSPEQRFELWRTAMTDPAMTADRFSLTKQDLRAAIDAIDDAFDTLPEDPAPGEVGRCLAKLPAPTVDADLYKPREFKDDKGKAREPTAKEQLAIPKPPKHARDALSTAQLSRLHKLVRIARAEQEMNGG